MFGWPLHRKRLEGILIRRQRLQTKQRAAFKLVLKSKAECIDRFHYNFNGVGPTKLQAGD